VDPSRQLPALVNSSNELAPAGFHGSGGGGGGVQQIAQDYVHPGPSLAQILAIASAYWRHTAVIAGLVLLGAAVISMLMPKTYKATTTLMVNYESNDPLAGKEFEIGMLGPYMSTQIELMESSEVLGPVIDSLKLTENPHFASGHQGGADTLRDFIETLLRKDLEIDVGKGGSQLIYITASMESADAAANLANAVADVYLEQEYQRTNSPAGERAKRYTEELEDLKRKVTVAQDAVTSFRQRTGSVDAVDKGDVDMDMLTQLEHRLLEKQNAMREVQAHAAADQAVSSQVLGSDLVRGLRGEGETLAGKMAQLRQGLGPNHPQVLQLQSEIDNNKRALAAAMHTYSEASASDLSIARNEVAELEKAVAAQRAKVLTSRTVRDEGSKYELELNSAQSVYKRALDGYDQIMFASTGHHTNVNLVSRARPPVTAAKPKPIINLLIGAVLGLGLGILGPFAYELTHRRVRCRDDVERDLGMPVLTEFQAITPSPHAA
jgi:protein tyrosine kinase modulator